MGIRRLAMAFQIGLQGTKPQRLEDVDHQLHRHRGVPGKTFGFAVKSAIVPIAHWRYDITETAGGCLVTESTWDNRPGLLKMFAASITGVADRDAANTENIRLTLERLKARAEAA